MSDKPNLYQRMNRVRQEVSYLKKDKQVEGYRAVTHDQVTGELRPFLIAHGIVTVVRVCDARTADTGTKTSKGTPFVRFEAVFEIDLVNVDDPSQRETYRVPAHAIDHGDKAPGKATSYAVKTALLKAFNIETGENDESRYGPDDSELAADRVAEIEKQMGAATSRAELRKLLTAAHEEAKSVGDAYAHKRFTATAGRLAESLPEVVQPRAKSVETKQGEDEPAKRDLPDAADPASKGLIKMLLKAGEARQLDEAGVLREAGIINWSQLGKAEAAALLKRLGEAA